jgi:hypothetical protein
MNPAFKRDLLFVVIVDNDLDLRDAMPIEFCHLESEVLVLNPFVLLWEVALDLKEQTSQRVGIAFNLLERLVIEIQYLV